MITIMIVDDEPPLREVLALLLEDAGYRTIIAAHGAQALELWEREAVDLVITDLMMPVMGGRELCTRLRDRGDVPIILMSAGGAEAAKEVPADAFLAKPFDLGVAEDLVQEMLKRPTPAA